LLKLNFSNRFLKNVLQTAKIHRKLRFQSQDLIPADRCSVVRKLSWSAIFNFVFIYIYFCIQTDLPDVPVKIVFKARNFLNKFIYF